MKDDGRFGPDTYAALQRKLGIEDDGIKGPQTTAALQSYLGVTVQGDWGPETTTALTGTVKTLVVLEPRAFGPIKRGGGQIDGCPSFLADATVGYWSRNPISDRGDDPH